VERPGPPIHISDGRNHNRRADAVVREALIGTARIRSSNIVGAFDIRRIA
jgi:hypothetical protein